MLHCCDILSPGITSEKVLENLKQRTRALPNPFERAAVIKEQIPSLAQNTLDKAQDAFGGMLILPGCPEKRFVGNPPLWHDDPFRNNEYIFQISRMNHWLPMLHTYHLTRDERYAQKIVDELIDWIETNPRPALYNKVGKPDMEKFNSPAAKAWRVLECGIRPYRTWCPVLEGLSSSPVLTATVLEQALCCLFQQCETVYAVSPLAWPKADHNHYLMENLGLLCVSCMFPELKDAAKWKAHAIDALCACMRAQVLESGAQIEGCPSYHNGCLFWFAMVLRYARQYHFPVPQEFIDKFSKMAQHSVYATRPNGTNVPWGDTSTLTGTLTKAAICTYLGTGDAKWFGISRHFYPYAALLVEAEEQIWRMENPQQFCELLRTVQESSKEPPLPLCHWDKGLKHVYLRTSWATDALSVMFACRTPVQNLHAHIDPCGFDFCAYGTPLVVDPGKYTYKDGENRRNFKSMAWHNTLTINEENAWEYIASWKYGAQNQGDVLAMDETPAFSWAMAQHQNYAPVIHTRAIALVEQKLLLVVDRLNGLCRTDTAQLHFHIDKPLAAVDKNCVYTEDSRNANIALYSTAGMPELVPAKVSDKNDIWRDSVIARYFWCNNAAQNKMAFATVLVPARAGEDIQAVSELTTVCKDNFTDVSFFWKDKHYTFNMDAEGIHRN